MAVYDYAGSFAQTNVSVNTTLNQIITNGQNYSAVGIFINSTDAATQLSSGYQTIDTIYSVNASNYSTVTNPAASGASTMYQWLSGYFANNTNGIVYLVIYTAGTGTAAGAIAPAYTAIDDYAYFKFLWFNGTEGATGSQYKLDLAALATACYADPMMSQLCVWTTDATGGIASVITTTAAADAWVIYSAATSANALLDNLAVCLTNVNLSGTAVGSKLDLITLSDLPSSGVANTNLSSTEITTLQGFNIGFLQTRGVLDGTSVAVSLTTLKGKIVSANWLIAYIDYMGQSSITQFLTSNTNTYKDNSAYQTILLLLSGIVNPFVSAGILSNYKSTAPAFSALPAAPLGTLNIPTAWTAVFDSRIGNVSISGNLTAI